MQASSYLLAGIFLLSSVPVISAQPATVNWPYYPTVVLAANPTGGNVTIDIEGLRKILAKGKAPLPVFSDSHFVLLKHECLGEMLDWYSEVTKMVHATPTELQKRGFMRSRTISMLHIFANRASMRDHPELEASLALGTVQTMLKKSWGDIKSGTTTDFLLVGTDQGWFVVDPVTRQIRPFVADANLWRFNLTRF